MPSPFTSPIPAHRREHFATDGFLVLPDLVAPGTVEALRADADAVLVRRLSEMAVTRTLDPRVTWWRLPSGRPYVLKIKPVVDLAPTAAAVAYGEVLSTLAADLLGARPRLMEDKFIYKQVVDVTGGWAELPVLGEEVRKHTDAVYFHARGYQRVLTVAVCLDSCTEQAGAIRVWPRSHQRAVEMIATDCQGPVVPDTRAPDAEAVTLVTEPGTVLLWDAALVHGSGPNVSGNPRRLLVLGYAPTGPDSGEPQ
ncbi:MAG: phytanoyl-CoA dioxygenase family protein [Actinobacteria bacterium]|nr:phytanoyl-CoA dioxygenase family protein [Actinomycetota bacterium]MBI3685930.1 phytanoyl-CoA dioxygenase family protein [Actinomycetota bacterium]